MKKKTKKILNIKLIDDFIFIGCAIIFYNLRGNLVFFYSPTELLENNGVSSQKIRLGGMVKKKVYLKKWF